MPIEFRCTGCQKLLRTPDGTQGLQSKCPVCGTVATIPDPDVPPPLPGDVPPPHSAAAVARSVLVPRRSISFRSFGPRGGS